MFLFLTIIAVSITYTLKESNLANLYFIIININKEGGKIRNWRDEELVNVDKIKVGRMVQRDKNWKILKHSILINGVQKFQYGQYNKIFSVETYEMIFLHTTLN